MSMKCDVSDNLKNILWSKRNDIYTNIEYIAKIFSYFSIYKCKKVINVSNGYDFLVEYKSKSYKVKVLADEMALELSEFTPSGFSHKELYVIIDNFSGDDCWYNVAKWIKRRC